MRQGQQNRRGRGRNRKGGGQNPLTRNLESNGPDVKIRGTAAHVAEKYMALARDAHSSGDPVLAENYLQHAEHYNRIIMAFRDQQLGHGDMPNGGQRFRGPNEPADFGDDYDDDGDDMTPGDGQPMVRMPGEPQPPVQQPMPPRAFDQAVRSDDYRPQDHDQNYGRNRFRPRHQGQRPHDQQRHDQQRHDQHRHQRHDGGQRPYQGHRPDRPERIERHERFEAPEPFERSVERQAEPPPAPEASPVTTAAPPADVAVAPAPAPAAAPASRAERGDAPARARRDRFAHQPVHEQPEFLRRPVRRPRRDAAATANGEGSGEPAAPSEPGPSTEKP